MTLALITGLPSSISLVRCPAILNPNHPEMYDSKGTGSTALKRLMTEYRGKEGAALRDAMAVENCN